MVHCNKDVKDELPQFRLIIPVCPMAHRNMSNARPTFLIGDIGGTNARFALIDALGDLCIEVLRCADYASLEAAIRDFLGRNTSGDAPPIGAAFAVAGPVTGDLVTLTNLSWQFSTRSLGNSLGLQSLIVINDFTAVALGVPRLGCGDYRPIGGGAPEPGTPIGVIGPGSGLGVSGLIPGQGGPIAIAGEGGHVTLAPTDDRECEVLGLLRRRFGHVSAERILSGPGLVTLFETLATLGGHTVQTLSAADITTAALAGTNSLCTDALEMFAGFLGTVAGNLALTLGARGGVYIAGGIAPRLGDWLEHSSFRRRFTEKGRHTAYLSRIPSYVVTHPLPAFLGLRSLVLLESHA
ncbi:MAG: glucokinase [Rhodospirillaceae bacterium]